MKTKMFVADDIRPEISGKQTALGLYSDDVVIVNIPPNPKKEIPIAIDRLSFLVNIAEVGSGEHKVTARLFAPSGKPYTVPVINTAINIENDKAHVIVIEMKPFITEGTGYYRWVINIDGEEHSHPFEVRIMELPQLAQTA